MQQLRIRHDQQVPDQPQRVIGSERGEQIHVQRDAGALQGSVQSKDKYANRITLAGNLWQVFMAKFASLSMASFAFGARGM